MCLCSAILHNYSIVTNTRELMKKSIVLIVAALLCAPAIAREKSKDYTTTNGDGTYSCSGTSAACAQVNQQRNAIWEQRQRDRERESIQKQQERRNR